jgi:ATP-dependent RNA helicase SUPV3L1/SUV3
VDALIASLGRGTDRPGLVRARPADDQRALEALSREADIRRIADRPDRVRLLWQVCQIPDFRKVMPETHARLLAQVYHFLTGPEGRLPSDWVAGHLDGLDRADGDMHALMDRISSIRVWTYVSHRADWLEDAAHWQGRARAIEDKLSDALHESLTRRFVDVRTSVLAKRLRDGQPLIAAVKSDDSVLVEGHHIGHLDGLTFLPDRGDTRSADRAVLNAAGRALRGEIARRIDSLTAAGDDAFAFNDRHRLTWRGAEVGVLAPGPDILRPRVEVPADDFVDGAAREAVRRRLAAWLADHVTRTLRPIAGAPPADLGGPGRGVLFQVAEGLGSLPAAAARSQVKALGEGDRRVLARLGLRFGTETVFVPRLLKPHAQALRARLWAAARGEAAPPPTPPGLMSLDAAPEVPEDFYGAIGYRVLAGRAVRVDVLERFAAEARRLLRDQRAGGGSDPLPPAALSLIGVTAAQGAAVLGALGHEATVDEAGGIAVRPRSPRTARPPHPARRPRATPPPAAAGRPADPDSPFAVLAGHAVRQEPAAPAPAPAPAPAKRRRRRKARRRQGADTPP